LNLGEMVCAFWLLKWELGVSVIIIGGLGIGLILFDESVALIAVYTLCVEVFLHKDLSLRKDLPHVAKSSMLLAGAIILILSMANALINFVVDQRIPGRVLDALLGLGLTETWQFLVVLNVFLLIIGMLMEGFSAILVAVPLILPFAARFGLHPFHLAMMFLLNLEIAYCAPPLGLNLFISSFRFERPLISLYRVVLPFTGILALGLLLVMYVPPIATVLVDGDIQRAKAEAKAHKEAPREAWLLECVQEDRSNPLPCSAEDKALWGADGTKNPYAPPDPPPEVKPASVDASASDAGGESDNMDDLFKEMMGQGAADAGASDAAADDASTASPKDDMDDLFKEMMK